MAEFGPVSALAPPFPRASAALAPLRAAAERQGRDDFVLAVPMRWEFHCGRGDGRRPSVGTHPAEARS